MLRRDPSGARLPLPSRGGVGPGDDGAVVVGPGEGLTVPAHDAGRVVGFFADLDGGLHLRGARGHSGVHQDEAMLTMLAWPRARAG